MTIDPMLPGVWRLIGAFIDGPGGQRLDYLGPEPKGRLILDPSGHMIALLTARERSGDPAALFGSMLAYTGRFTGDLTTFTTRVDAAWLPAWEGSEQLREYVVAGDRLTVRTAPTAHPAFPDTNVCGILEWQREG